MLTTGISTEAAFDNKVVSNNEDFRNGRCLKRGQRKVENYLFNPILTTRCK